MCLVLFAYDPKSENRLVVAANRDELYARPAHSAHYWEDNPGVLAGRDLSAGGTWLGVNRSGSFATVTNFAEEGPSEAPLSRGRLPERFLSFGRDADDFAHHLQGLDYRGFNLLLWDGERLVYTSNRGVTRVLAPGVYGLANAELGADWPKVTRGCRALTSALKSGVSTDSLISLLADRWVPADHDLPRRGRPLALERQVAPCFIASDEYGTRASTAVIIGTHRVRFAEQEYGPKGVPGDRSEFEFNLA